MKSFYLASFRIGSPRIGLAAALLAGLAGHVFAGEVQSLRVAERVQGPGDRPGSVVVTYHLVNDSKKTITAWDFGCVTANQAGYATQSVSGNDAYYLLELQRRQGFEAPPGSSLIPPGGRIIRTVELREPELDGPYAAKSCGPILAIFDDATYEGAPLRAESLFESRSRDAISAYLTKAELESELESGVPLRKALNTVVIRRQRPASGPEGSDLGAARLETYLELENERGLSEDKGRKYILAELDAYYQGAMAHLPPSWQRKVRSEVQP